MKKLILFIINIILFISCSEDFLERTPLSEVSSENFYKTENDMIAAINAVYDPLQHVQFYKRAGFRWGAKTDEMYRAFDWYNYAYTPSSASSNAMWSNMYQGILAANVVLQKLPDSEISQELKNRISGEANYLRGFYYYHLLRWFGDVPIITEMPTAETNFQVPRNPKSEVYEFIIKEFNDAIDLLPLKSEYPPSEIGRTTKGAARTMLADMYLFRAAPGDYQKVLQLTEALINSNEYELENSYSDIFELNNENGIESIFEVQFQSGGQGEGNHSNQWIAIYNSTSVQEEFFNNWDSTDVRREVAVIEPGESKNDYFNNSPFFHQGKMVLGRPGPGKLAGGFADAPINYMVQRYANILLMRAEVLNEVNDSPPEEAVDNINRLRQRAGLEDIPYSISKEKFRQIIREEKKYELAFEGHRWFDLLRYEKMGFGGGVTDVLADPESPHFNSNIELPKHFLQPIPQVEIDRNPLLTQNSGY